MKKKAIVLLAFAAALTAVSCQKEDVKEAETTPMGEGMTISAVSEGIGADVKADLAYKYDVIWRTGDKICVKNSEKSVEFTLTDGEGTTKGTFSSGESISGEVEGFYPASVANLIWPAEQQNNHVPPMYCKKTLSSTQNQTFNFASLGSVLQLNFNSTTAGIVLKSIEVKADEAMSGAFTIKNGQAKVSQPEGDKPGITLDLGEGVTLGTSAKKFNIAVPAGEYNNLSIVLTAKNGKECTINAKKDKAIEIVFNTVNTLAVSGEFKYNLPDGALPGIFTVSPEGKKVYFSKGNLTCSVTDTKWSFYEHQYDCATSYNPNLISLFTWGYGTWSASPNSTDFQEGNFTDWGSQIGDGKTWRTLTTAEWQYLFNTRKMENGGTGYENLTESGITVEGVTFKGVVLFPDDFTDQADWKTEYKTWKALNDAGIVFLPAAGHRDGSNVSLVGFSGYYWSSTAYGDSGTSAYGVDFNWSGVSPGEFNVGRDGCSVRLITESK